MMHRAACLAVAIVALAAAGPVPAVGRTRDPAACRVATVLLSRLESRKPKVFLGPADTRSGAGFGWRRDPPSDTLARAFQSVPAGSPLTACRSFSKALAVRGIRIDPRAVGVRASDGDYRETLVAMSMPVLSPDGLEAMAQVDEVYGAEAGGGTIYHLRRQPGGPWRVTDRVNAWVS